MSDAKQDEKVYPDVEPDEDKVYRIAEAVTSLLPAGQVVLHSLIVPPIQKRMEEWIEKIENRLMELEKEERVDLESLKDNQEFSALLLRTIQSAAITSQEEQLDNLRNYVLNITLPNDHSEDELYIILSIISDFTPSHARALHFYCFPEEYMDQISKFNRSINLRINQPSQNRIGQELSEILGNGDMDYWLYVFNILDSKNLVEARRITPIQTSPDIIINAVSTEFGKKVMSMIKDV